MDRAVDIGKRIIDGSIKAVGIQIDPDVDGFTSAAAVFLLLRALSSDVYIHNYLPSEKEHGFTDAYLPVPIDLLIMPDAGSDPVSFGNYRLCEDMEVLVLDHHPYNHLEIPSNCTLINCRDEQYPNPTLTGVGVVYKFYEAMWVATEGTEVHDRLGAIQDPLLQLVALGMVADVADLRNLETRGYVLEGIERIQRDLERLREGKETERPYSLMAELLEANAFSTPHGATIMSLGWYIAPPMNALIRLGNQPEKGNLYYALCFEKERVEYQPRRKKASDSKPEKQMVTYQQDAARLCRNIKVRQDKLTTSAKNKYTEKVSSEDLKTNSIIVINRDQEDTTPSTLTGLIANKLAALYRRPVLLVTEDEDGMCSGSGRGYDKAGIADFKGLLASTGLFQMLGGHPNAFGARIHADNIDPLIKAVNKVIPLDTMEVSYVVDFEVDGNKLTKDHVEDVGGLYGLWGNHIDEPLFAVTDIRLKPEDIEAYSDGRIIGFTYNGVRYSKKYCKNGEYEDITQRSNRQRIGPKRDLELAVIGTFQQYEKDDDVHSYVEVKEWCSWEVEDWDDEDF